MEGLNITLRNLIKDLHEDREVSVYDNYNRTEDIYYCLEDIEEEHMEKNVIYCTDDIDDYTGEHYYRIEVE